MKRTLLLAGASALLVTACAGLAYADVTNDGKATTWGTAVYNDSNNNYGVRTWPTELGYGNQDLVVKMPAHAWIPCYLELQVTGNSLNVKTQSWGQNAGDTVDTSAAAVIAFHPAIGGYVDAGWNQIGTQFGDNVEVGPDAGVFIKSCDIFKSVIWSNMPYQYSVVVPNGGLKGQDAWNNSEYLKVDMRWDKTLTDLGTASTSMFSFVPTTTTSIVVVPSSPSNAGVTSTLFQQFRVPFDRTVKAGKYLGEVNFCAATL